MDRPKSHKQPWLGLYLCPCTWEVCSVWEPGDVEWGEYCGSHCQHHINPCYYPSGKDKTRSSQLSQCSHATKLSFPHSVEKPCVKVRGCFQREHLRMEANNSVPSCWKSVFPAAQPCPQLLVDKSGVNSAYRVHVWFLNASRRKFPDTADLGWDAIMCLFTFRFESYWMRIMSPALKQLFSWQAFCRLQGSLDTNGLLWVHFIQLEK